MDTSAEPKPEPKPEAQNGAVKTEVTPVPPPKTELEEAREKMEQSRRKTEEKIRAKELKQEQEAAAAAAAAAKEEDDNIDPLDAFMLGVNEEVKKINQGDRKKAGSAGRDKAKVMAVGDKTTAAEGNGEPAQGVGYHLIYSVL